MAASTFLFARRCVDTVGASPMTAESRMAAYRGVSAPSFFAIPPYQPGLVLGRAGRLNVPEVCLRFHEGVFCTGLLLTVASPHGLVHRRGGGLHAGVQMNRGGRSWICARHVSRYEQWPQAFRRGARSSGHGEEQLSWRGPGRSVPGALGATCDYNRRPAVSLKSARSFDAGQGAQDTVRTGSRRSDGGGDASGLQGEAVRLDPPRRSNLPGLVARGKELKAR